MISDSGGALPELSVISNVSECEAKCKTRRNAQCRAQCMHVAPRCGPRWYNFTILLSPDQISREETI